MVLGAAILLFILGLLCLPVQLRVRGAGSDEDWRGELALSWAGLPVLKRPIARAPARERAPRSRRKRGPARAPSPRALWRVRHRIGGLLRELHLEIDECRIRLGLDSPDETGRLYGYWLAGSALLPGARRIQVTPRFIGPELAWSIQARAWLLPVLVLFRAALLGLAYFMAASRA